MWNGLRERLKKELDDFDDGFECKIVAPPKRKYSVWIGGSIMTSLSAFSERWIGKDEYDEYGPTIVGLYCF